MVMKYVQLGDFTTQAGAVIPQVRIAYEMWGQQRGNNVILVEHALTGDADARLLAVLVCRPRDFSFDELDAMLREARAIAAMLGDPSASPCPTPPESPN